MRLLSKAAHPDGSMEVRVSVGTAEDLWHLYNFILVGDLVLTKTRRKVPRENALGTLAAEMKMLKLEVEVKHIAFTPDELRIQGVNKKENNFVKTGAHHTLTIHANPPQEVRITKREWDSICEDRLKDACDESGKADTAAVLMSFGEAQVLLVTRSFVHIKAKVEVTISKKHKSDGKARDKSIERFFKQSLDALVTHVDFEKTKLVLLCSPGHVREEFHAYIKEVTQRADHGPLREVYLNLSRFLLVKVSSTTISGLKEALSDPGVAQRMESTKCVDDIRMWEKFQDTMNKDPDRCVYTPQYVYYAAMAGAVGGLMISDDVFRSENPTERRFFLSLVNFVRQSGSPTVNVFSSKHVTGEQLTQLGSVAAVLRFSCPEIDDMEVVPEFLASKEVEEFIRANATARVTV
ncbi:cell cycle regulation-like protein [Leishmania major strain Friedlin]|uniref:Protein pelota homolog n=1 Tax=Leishmania major TaxID=5664 RepID=Q4Q9H1_LEIMA|nr:cell cycle regulation-like protein [Leishmania major strain Friedlin]CAG9576270.1 eukaryotic_peptide_chain_release_factor_subunit_1_-_putative [Leishmania major strain Friedlin]CAJ04540.1 cell cycle regulation-like protein [Leishmania major strain Friedlin]|eukprot:XP_001684027.1 cell cycle regulation-like protein [Leishmania major strain Friedlin]